MIYVLSGSRRETSEWAKSQDIPLRQARHVYTSTTLPGRISKTQRVVSLPGFAKRRDRHAIIVQLRRSSSGKARIEIWVPGADGELYCIAGPQVPPAVPDPQMPLDALTALAAELQVEEDFSIEDESGDETVLAVADESERPPTVTITPTTDDPPASHLELVERVLPTERDVTEVVKVTESATEPKPKRKGRRTNEQKAYDETLIDYHENKATLEQVIAARDALAERHPDDERLLNAPQSDEEADQAADDGDLDF